MGIYDRDYYRDRPGPRFGTVQMFSVTTWLMIINVAVFLLDIVLFRLHIYGLAIDGETGQRYVFQPLYWLGYFSYSKAIGSLEIWRFLTFQFLHANITHLIFNMLGLYFFGPMIESYLGRGRFLAFYLLCGIGGPIAYVLLWATHFLNSADAALVGASAGIFGVLIAAAQVAPDTTVLLYGAFPMKLRTQAWALLAIAIFTILRYGEAGLRNSGGEAAHLGGAAVGYILIYNPNWLRIPRLDFLRRRRPPF